MNIINKILFFCAYVTTEEILKITKGLNANSSSGQDDIPTKLVVSTISSTAHKLEYLIKLSFNKGVFPNCFKVAKIVPIEKTKGNFHALELESAGIGATLLFFQMATRIRLVVS